MRPIDADALRAELMDAVNAPFLKEMSPSNWVEAYMAFVRALDRAPTLDYAPKWIGVEDRLPPYIGKKILVVNGHGCIDILAFWKKVGSNWEWLDCNGHFKHTNDINHWMPLPEAPKDGGWKHDKA